MGKTINVLITINTNAVKKFYPQPSKDQNRPTEIGDDYGYMVATGTVINSGQGTGDLNITAFVGDTLRVFATSGSYNFEDAVLVYGFPKFSGNEVFSLFNYQNFTKSTVVPQSLNSMLPGRIVVEEFWFYQASVISRGTENYRVQFALYTRNADSGYPDIFGYFEWEATMTVKG
ncbi:inclusion body family protein [Anabaena cylindrica UHCC 0172]|uniref:inclusion body family protein n=1 Tax=Anabaena cylindrica TaxID=1165 RepID=UPI002B2085D1|nr:inclusion body family protein [Anabaena cylindrica]MEA5552720.1 inclusion body family protein [Anabaena cylindrica UHCC 0172]